MDMRSPEAEGCLAPQFVDDCAKSIRSNDQSYTVLLVVLGF